jgi:hypothetical protein
MIPRRGFRMGSALWVVLCLVGGAVVSARTAIDQPPASVDHPSTTEDRVENSAWWPTKGDPPSTAYAGDEACGKCHSKEAATQTKTPMARAAFRAAHENAAPPADFTSGSYLYRVAADATGLRLVVSSGGHEVATPITWIMGAGVHGQTYMLEQKGVFYESQVSTFAGRGMDLSPGHSPIPEDDLRNASGERLSLSMTARCFACHTSQSSIDGKLDSALAIPGVHCEACHGPGAAHVSAMLAGRPEDALQHILNPAHLSPVGSVDFCGACPRTSLDVIKEKTYGAANVRFQPYRLEKSRCWGEGGDARLTCIACHNPHEPLARTASSYDTRCLSCHRARGMKSCPRATANCASCHMPKYEVPGMHAQFTDHFIRVVRIGEPYPN